MQTNAKFIRRESDDVLDRFTKKFSLPSKPAADLPELPRHLDDLSDADLMDLYTEFMSWLSYVKAELVKSEINEEREFNYSRLIDAKVLIEQWGAEAKGDRVTIAKARRDIDNRVVAQQEAHREARAYRKLTESVFDRCERGAQLLSRELSRRISNTPREGRATRYSP
jgi:hypothetical protein